MGKQHKQKTQVHPVMPRNPNRKGQQTHHIQHNQISEHLSVIKGAL